MNAGRSLGFAPLVRFPRRPAFAVPVDDLRLVVPFDYYPNKTVTELLALLTSVQNRGTKGELSMTTGAGLQQVRSWQNSESTPVTIRRLLYSLHRKDPVTYADPYADRVRKTRASFTRS